VPVYALGQDCFLVDDTSVDYSAPAAGISPADGAMDGGVPQLPGDGGNGWNGTNSSEGESSSYTLLTNGLYLNILGITNGIVSLTLNNATDMVYEIFSTVSLTNPVWNIEQEVWALTNQTWTPFTVNMLDRTNSLYFWARDWAGIFSDGNLTVPEWWLYYYYGTTAISETNLDSRGNALVSDFQNSVDPNVISFAVNVTNQDFNSSSATVQITVSGGVPSYMAALVDSLDYSTAQWAPYNSNLVVNLGTVEGWHTVSVGLRGLPPNAQQTWVQIQLKLVLTAPVLIVTNPVPGLVTQPFIQLQGYSLENLTRISYDLNNSNGFESNLQAFVTTRYFDTNNLEYTTNGFECFNVPMAIGTNTVTLHATDSAGNVAITNLVYVFDPTANTNPPVINLSWPPNNAAISGTTFPVRGIVNDPFAVVSAQIANAGGSNVLNGVVEQNGSFWIENVPLGAGTNYLTITATNALGYGSASNIVVIQSSLTLTIDSYSLNDPWAPTANVTCTLAGSSDIVLVNGIAATQNYDGSWTASPVPVSASGTIAITAQAVASAGLPSGSGPANMAVAAASSGGPSAADAQTSMDVVRGSGVALVDLNWNNPWQWELLSPAIIMCNDIMNSTTHWSYGSPGFSLQTGCLTEIGYPNYPGLWGVETNIAYGYVLTEWDATGNGQNLGSIAPVCGEINGGFSPWSWDPGVLYPYPGYTEEANYQWSTPYESGQWLNQQRYALKTGGQAIPGQQNLWVVHATANQELDYLYDGPADPANQITMAGQTLDANNNVYLLLADNASVDVTPIVPGDATFITQPTAHVASLLSLTVVSNSATEINATNWAVVKTNGYVTLQATLSDNDAGSYLQWAGGGQAVPGNPLQWQVSAATPTHATITASLGPTKLSLNVWVIWGTVNIFTSGPDPDPLNFFQLMGLSNILGPIPYNNGTCANGQICAVATITPAGVHNLITNRIFQVFRG
jgi:hypothetical protein